MKRYVAKWLPVDGPIENGDWVRWGNIVGPVIAAGGKDIKKVKLFLCEPKIEVGAPAQWSSLDEWKAITEVNLHEEYIVLEGDDQKYYIDDCRFKYYESIGQISPDAYGYVQDGNRFDESEVSFETWYTYDKNGIGTGVAHGKISKVGDAIFADGSGIIQSITKIIVFIKGPCGHFH